MEEYIKIMLKRNRPIKGIHFMIQEYILLGNMLFNTNKKHCLKFPSIY